MRGPRPQALTNSTWWRATSARHGPRTRSQIDSRIRDGSASNRWLQPPGGALAYALVMRREVASAGKWLAGTSIGVGLCGYLIATVAAGGRHPFWPYFLFGAVALRDSPSTSQAAAPAKQKIAAIWSSVGQSWARSCGRPPPGGG